MEEKILSRNPHLKQIFNDAEFLFEKPMVINEISFAPKSTVEEGMIMIGDSAGLIAPLCGNGMAMAIHAAKLASEVMIRFFSDKPYTRNQMERDYQRQWNAKFASRLYLGRKIQTIVTNARLFDTLFSLIPNSERFLQTIIKQTHGKPILA